MTENVVRRRRAPADRPPPDWAQVCRRNHLERLKRDHPPLAVRGELAELASRGYEAVPEEDMVRLHWWGIAHDKPKTGSFMVRVKVPGGRLEVEQARGVGRLARIWCDDRVELTTRQGIQLHGLALDDLPGFLAAIEALGLRTVGAEGDTVRNVTGCPVAGLTADEPFDVTPTITAVADFFDGRPEYSNLPRKHKYTISGCPAQCNAPEIADVALVATLRQGRPGFAVRVGGGLANTPRISRDLGVFVPEEDALEVLRAVTDAWQSDLGYRLSRARARIKFFVDDHGPAGVRAKVEERLGRRLLDGDPVLPVGEADHMGVHRQRQPDRVLVGVPVPSGRLRGTQLEQLADLVDPQHGDMRLTRQQNLLVTGVRVRELPRATRSLAALGLPPGRGRTFARSVACTDHRFCNYSVASTKDKLEEVLVELTRRHGAETIGALAVHLDGCPHACAQHWVGEVGLQGTTTHLPGSGERVEAYDLTVGGGLGRRTAIGRRLLRRVPTGELAPVLDRLVVAWLGWRASRGSDGSGFGEFCDAHGDEELVAIATGGTVTGPEAADPAGVVLRLPGPLHRYVDGVDEVVLTGSTVADLLADLRRRHPGLGRVLAPDGAVAASFLLTLGDDDIRALRGTATPVGPADVVSVVMAMAGG